jgi:hypothetical protein
LLSEYVFRETEARLATAGDDDRAVAVARVEVWENETSCAIFEP